MTKPDPLARFTLLVLLPNRGLRWVRQSPRVTSQQLESTVRLLFQIFGPTDENGKPDPNANPAGLGGIEGMHRHIHDLPDGQGRSFSPTSVLFLLHVVTAFVCDIALLRVRDPRSVRSRRSARLHWHWDAAPLFPRHPPRMPRGRDRRWQVWGLDCAPPTPAWDCLPRMPNLQDAAHHYQPASGGGHGQKKELLRSADRAHHRLALHPAVHGARRHRAGRCQACDANHRRCCRTSGRYHTPSSDVARDGRRRPCGLYASMRPPSPAAGVDSHLDLRHANFSRFWELQLVFAASILHFLARCVGLRPCALHD